MRRKKRRMRRKKEEDEEKEEEDEEKEEGDEEKKEGDNVVEKDLEGMYVGTVASLSMLRRKTKPLLQTIFLIQKYVTVMKVIMIRMVSTMDMKVPFDIYYFNLINLSGSFQCIGGFTEVQL